MFSGYHVSFRCLCGFYTWGWEFCIDSGIRMLELEFMKRNYLLRKMHSGIIGIGEHKIELSLSCSFRGISGRSYCGLRETQTSCQAIFSVKGIGS